MHLRSTNLQGTFVIFSLYDGAQVIVPSTQECGITCTSYGTIIFLKIFSDRTLLAWIKGFDYSCIYFCFF